MVGDLIAALTWPIDVQQELRETDDEPDLVTDYVSLLAAQVEYKVRAASLDQRSSSSRTSAGDGRANSRSTSMSSRSSSPKFGSATQVSFVKPFNSCLKLIFPAGTSVMKRSSHWVCISSETSWLSEMSPQTVYPPERKRSSRTFKSALLLC